MSNLVEERLISMWSNEELRDKLDSYTCLIGADEFQSVVAEALSRLLSAHPRMGERKVEVPQ